MEEVAVIGGKICHVSVEMYDNKYEHEPVGVTLSKFSSCQSTSSWRHYHHWIGLDQ